MADCGEVDVGSGRVRPVSSFRRGTLAFGNGSLSSKWVTAGPLATALVNGHAADVVAL